MIYEVQNVTFGYTKSTKVLKGVSFRVDAGDTLAILGANGVGKTTLLNILIGLIPYQEGKIELCGRSVKNYREKELSSKVGYVSQGLFAPFEFTVLEFVLMGLAAKKSIFYKPNQKDEAKALALLELYNISHLAHKPYGKISGGEKQMASIVRAIIKEPQVIILDEPMSHLDFGNQQKTLEIITRLNAEGYTIIFTTHDPNHPMVIGGKVLLIEQDGHGSWGSATAMLTADNLKRIYKRDLQVEYLDKAGRNICFFHSTKSPV